ncbi:hypothetical protein ACJIZ3_012540 [Penstemon smallii]|uniref:Uncharacterized protein n=1 Tax=Penstemon smallii TaxID=265156 RepID=A0ABD3UQ90_9LAMI
MNDFQFKKRFRSMMEKLYKIPVHQEDLTRLFDQCSVTFTHKMYLSWLYQPAAECIIPYDYRSYADAAGDNVSVTPTQNQTTTTTTTNNNNMYDNEQVEGDYFDGVFTYIKHMLMDEDDLEQRPCMFQDCSALQAAEKYFYDALNHDDREEEDEDDKEEEEDLDLIHQQIQPPPSQENDFGGFADWSQIIGNVVGPSTSSYGFDWGLVVSSDTTPFHHVFNQTTPNTMTSQIHENRVHQPLPGNDIGGKENSSTNNGFRQKIPHDRGDDNGDRSENNNNRCTKQLASYTEDSEPLENYDKSLLCPGMNPNFYHKPPASHSVDPPVYEDESQKQFKKSKEVKRGRPKGTKKNSKVKEVVDLRALLTRCAQAASTFNTSTAEELLKQIRQYSSAYGDPNERLAHSFANALEARMAGTGSALYTACATRRITASELLKSYQTYVTSCPFKRMSNICANKTIAKFTKDAERIHIIDFGILYGFQWPCIIHGISLRPGGPPKLKITGIDYPQPGFKPAERVEQTGRRLMNCCKRFNVPFEYNAIAKKWEDIRLEDLNIEREEMVVVNCLYRLRHVADECAGVISPRDMVLKLIKKINPKLFVHGVVNGTYNAPFFGTRFREALYHYSSFFDMLEATLPREDQDRLLYEREVFGRDVMNVIACEGSERVERPETYKQWMVRNQRAGFRQRVLDAEIMKEVKVKVMKGGYHKDFLLDEDSNWMLQGWKGRVMYALSSWEPLPVPDRINQ